MELVERIGVAEVETFLSVKPLPDVIVLDPPLATVDPLSDEELLAIFRLIPVIAGTENVFVFVWTEPTNLSKTMQTACAAGLAYCDCICAELFDEHMREARIVAEDGTDIGSARMILLFKTCKDLKREMFAQQRTADVGVGQVRRSGKSRGRWGMPQIPHEIAENMWPPLDTEVKRSFVELWPTRMSPRRGWRMLDEQC
jgi:hypothetical protein